MRSKKELHVSPWEITHQQKALLQIEIAPKSNQTQQRQRINEAIQQKRIQQNGSQKSSLIVKSKYLSSIDHTIQSSQKTIRQKLKTHYDSKKSYFSAKKQQKDSQQNPKEHKKLDISIKPITKNDLMINIPLKGVIKSKIIIDRPIKHMQKNHKQSPLLSQRKVFKHQFKYLDMPIIGKQSVDNLGKKNKNYQTMKKSQEYDDQIIKKCSLKNIQIYDEENPSQKQAKKTQIIKKIRIENKKHILDRILTKFQ